MLPPSIPERTGRQSYITVRTRTGRHQLAGFDGADLSAPLCGNARRSVDSLMLDRVIRGL